MIMHVGRKTKVAKLAQATANELRRSGEVELHAVGKFAISVMSKAVAAAGKLLEQPPVVQAYFKQAKADDGELVVLAFKVTKGA